MRRNLIGEAAIRERAKGLDIPMEWLFAGYVLEQLAVKLAKSERGRRLLLKNPGVLGLEAYGRGSSHRLIYCYLRQPGEIFDKAGFALFLKSTIKWEKETDIEWSWRSHMEGRRLYVEITASLDGMRMPIELVVDSMEEASLAHPAKEYGLRLVMENNKTETVLLYPAEELLFDDLAEVFAKLELVGDMAVYERIYDILNVTGFEGRQLQKQLVSFLSEREIKMDEVRYAQMEAYLTYPFMIKKWKAYLKRNRRTAPGWDEVYGRFWSFIQPLWSANLHGMVYLGSWIPDLCRYLD